MKKLIQIISILLTGVLNASAQDALFSQYYYYPSYLNVATSGSLQGLLINGGKRSQWMKVPGTFNSTNGSISAQIARFHGSSQGLSFTFNQSEDGEGYLNTGRYNLGYAYHGRLPYKIPLHFHLGFGFTYIQRKIDWTKLIFSDQLDQVLGNIYPSSINAPADLNYNATTSNFGFILGGKGKWLKNKDEVEWNLGYSVNNLFSFRKSFYSYDVFSSRRQTVHGELLVPITALKGALHNGDPRYNPQFMFNYQGGLRMMDITNFITHEYFKAGFGYRTVRYPFDFRNNNQVIYYLGINKVVSDKFYLQILYSYDQSLDKLVTAVGSTHEVSICLYLSNFGKGSKGDKPCTEFLSAGRLDIIGFPEDDFKDMTKGKFKRIMKRKARKKKR